MVLAPRGVMSKKPDTNKSAHAERSATHALEEHAQGAKRTRKSTRKSANRSKPESTLEIREAARNNTPSARHARRG